MVPRVGDPIFVDSALYELADSGPPRLIAEGRRAENEMQDMVSRGYRY
jgi:hypothetical protein